jgi:cytochrome c553
MMRRTAFVLALGGGLLAGAIGHAEGDREAGRKLAGQCRTCHGLDGQAQIPIAPNIGGESASYLRAQLMAFRDGTREHEMMTIVASSLSDAQIADLAAWYSGHDVSATPPDPAAAPEACIACHGADGLAQVEDAPHLAGETSMYIDTQLHAFKRGKRVHDVMTGIAENLSEDEIRAAADYFSAIEIEITQVD